MRYGLALLFVLIALGLTLALQYAETDRPTLFLLFAAIVASAWFGGAGPGCVAVGLSIPAGLYFYGGAWQPDGVHLDSVLLFLFFGVCAMAGGTLSSWQRETEEGLQRTHRQLEIKARELQQSNDALIAEMAERRSAELKLHDAQAELANAARLTSMGELAASIAHEINQPLAAVVMSAGSCLRWLDSGEPNFGEARDAATRIVRDAKRAADVIGRVRALARGAVPDKLPLDLNATIADVLAMLEHELERHRITVRRVLAPGLLILDGDRVQLQQVFLNLLMNAIESLAASETRAREIIVRTAPLEGTGISAAIEDNGAGFDEVSADKIFDAFVTTKLDGMGLGLAICRSIVEAHGGTLAATRREPLGAILTVTFPPEGELA